MQVILELDILSGSGVGHGTPDFDALSERSNYRRESQRTVAEPPTCSCASVTHHTMICKANDGANIFSSTSKKPLQSPPPQGLYNKKSDQSEDRPQLTFKILKWKEIRPTVHRLS